MCCVKGPAEVRVLYCHQLRPSSDICVQDSGLACGSPGMSGKLISVSRISHCRSRPKTATTSEDFAWST